MQPDNSHIDTPRVGQWYLVITSSNNCDDRQQGWNAENPQIKEDTAYE